MLFNLLTSMNFGVVIGEMQYNHNLTAGNFIYPNDIPQGGDGNLADLATWLGFNRITSSMKSKMGYAPRVAIIDNGFTYGMYYEHPTAFTRLAYTSESGGDFVINNLRIDESINSQMDNYMSVPQGTVAGHGDSVVNIIYQLHSKLGISISKLQFYDYMPRNFYTGEIPTGVTNTEEEKATIAILEDIYNNNNTKADIITMSLGFDSLTLPGWVILDQLIQAGVVIIASAGNGDIEINQMPAHENDVFAVGAVHYNNSNSISEPRRISKQTGNSWGSNYGQYLDYMMPGENIEVYYYNPYNDNAKTNVLFGGTSAAAPIFATLTAFAWRYYFNVKGEAPDTFNLKTLFSESTDGYYHNSTFGEDIVRAPIEGDHSPSGRSNYVGYGVLDLYDLLVNIDAYIIPGIGNDGGIGSGGTTPCIGVLCFEP